MMLKLNSQNCKAFNLNFKSVEIGDFLKNWLIIIFDSNNLFNWWMDYDGENIKINEFENQILILINVQNRQFRKNFIFSKKPSYFIKLKNYNKINIWR